MSVNCSFVFNLPVCELLFVLKGAEEGKHTHIKGFEGKHGTAHGLRRNLSHFLCKASHVGDGYFFRIAIVHKHHLHLLPTETKHRHIDTCTSCPQRQSIDTCTSCPQSIDTCTSCPQRQSTVTITCPQRQSTMCEHSGTSEERRSLLLRPFLSTFSLHMSTCEPLTGTHLSLREPNTQTPNLHTPVFKGTKAMIPVGQKTQNVQLFP